MPDLLQAALGLLLTFAADGIIAPKLESLLYTCTEEAAMKRVCNVLVLIPRLIFETGLLVQQPAQYSDAIAPDAGCLCCLRAPSRSL